MMAPCLTNNKNNEKWELTEDGLIRQIELNLCLDHRNLNVQSHVYAKKCDPMSETQKWEFSN